MKLVFILLLSLVCLGSTEEILLKKRVINTQTEPDFFSVLKKRSDLPEKVQVIVNLSPMAQIEPILNACGVTSSKFIPKSTHVLYCSQEAISQFKEDKNILWIGHYSAELRIKSEEGTVLNGQHEFRVEYVAGVPNSKNVFGSAIKEELSKISSNFQLKAYESHAVVSVSGHHKRDFVQKVASMEFVHSVESQPVFRPFNQKGSPLIQTGTLSDTLLNKGLDGKGIIIGISDSGIDYRHCFFYDPEKEVNFCRNNSRAEDCYRDNGHRKIVGYYSANADDIDISGHGTHVAGTAAGYPFSPKTIETELAYNNSGVAPMARIALYDVEFGPSAFFTVPSMDEDLLDYLYSLKSSLSTHSWGSGPSEYDSFIESIDRFIFNHPDHLVLFSGGNNGQPESAVSSPSINKNGISVASSDPVVTTVTSDFSSRGPTFDGRIKPDLTAPGHSIWSAKAGKQDGKTQPSCGPSNLLLRASGTSMASPNLAGAAALVYQYYKEGHYCKKETSCAFDPTAALVKATLINSAQHFVDPYVPSVNAMVGSAGYGRPQLNDVLDFEGGRKLIFFDRKKLRSYDRFETTVMPTFKGSLNVVLVWTDPTASSASSKILVNDLDLVVISPSGKMFYGNDYLELEGQPQVDNLNNVERVLIPIEDLEYGNYTVRVTSTVISGTWAQNFALVINLESKSVYRMPASDVRLSEGHQGRLEFKVGRSWSTVCSTRFDQSSVPVICRQLGFPDSNKHMLLPYPKFGQGTGKIFDRIHYCIGYEKVLTSCESLPVDDVCTHEQDVSVICDCPQETHFWNGSTCQRINVCEPKVYKVNSSLELLDLEWQASFLEIQESFPIEGVILETKIQHWYPGDLVIELKKDSIVSYPSIGGGEQIFEAFNGAQFRDDAFFVSNAHPHTPFHAFPYIKPLTNFTDFSSISSAGIWTINITDTFPIDSGFMSEWSLKFVPSLTCPCSACFFDDCLRVCDCGIMGLTGFNGDTCTQDINECDKNPCIAPAVCINTIGSYRCDCPFGMIMINGLCFNDGTSVYESAVRDNFILWTFDSSNTLDEAKQATFQNNSNPLVSFPQGKGGNNKAMRMNVPLITSSQICYSKSFQFDLAFRIDGSSLPNNFVILAMNTATSGPNRRFSLNVDSNGVVSILVFGKVVARTQPQVFRRNTDYFFSFFTQSDGTAYLIVNGVIAYVGNPNIPRGCGFLTFGHRFVTSTSSGLVDLAAFSTNHDNKVSQAFAHFSLYQK